MTLVNPSSPIGSVRVLDSSCVDIVWACDCGEANEWRVSPGGPMHCGKCEARVTMRVSVVPERQTE